MGALRWRGRLQRAGSAMTFAHGFLHTTLCSISLWTSPREPGGELLASSAESILNLCCVGGGPAQIPPSIHAAATSWSAIAPLQSQRQIFGRSVLQLNGPVHASCPAPGLRMTRPGSDPSRPVPSSPIIIARCGGEGTWRGQGWGGSARPVQGTTRLLPSGLHM